MTTVIKREYLNFPEPVPPYTPMLRLINQIRGIFLAPFYWLAAYGKHAPGLHIHRKAVLLGLQLTFRPQSSIRRGWGYHFVTFPMDSTRYFEMDFAYRFLDSLPLESKWLDVSSPRLLLILALRDHPDWKGEFINPDDADLAVTQMLIDAAGVKQRCYLHNILVGDAPFAPESFDLITSISVLEHIPDDKEALTVMWRLLKPGGRLILTIPCARQALEQYVNRNDYALLTPNEDGYVFFQRIFDQNLLIDHIFSVIGQPNHLCVWGEKKLGYLTRMPNGSVLRGKEIIPSGRNRGL